MGLLGKAIAWNNTGLAKSGSQDIQAAIGDFYQKNSLFHCLVLQFPDDSQQGLSDIAVMTASFGAVCHNLHDRIGLVLLPGVLDMELFSHRLSRSTSSTVLFQFSASSPSLAIKTLTPYL